MINLKSKIAQEVFGYFFLHEGVSLYVNEMARRLHLDSGNLTRKLVEFEQEGILRSETRGNQKYYFLNPSFPLLAEYKRIATKTFGFEHLLREIFGEVKGLKKAFLFGSYASNKMDSSSDIDLLAIGEHKPLELHKKIADIQKKIDREINLISMSSAEFESKQKTDPFIKSIRSKPMIPLL